MVSTEGSLQHFLRAASSHIWAEMRKKVSSSLVTAR